MLKFSFAAALVISQSIFASSDTLNKKWNSLLESTDLKSQKQSYCFYKDGRIFGQNIDLKVRPASVSKIYTTYWALEKLTKHHRFETTFFLKGEDLFIKGGSDPFFVTENLFLLNDYLNKIGVNKLQNVYFDSEFYFNWSSESETIRKQLLKMLNTKSYNSQTKQLKAKVIKKSQIDTTISDMKESKLTVERVTFKNFILNEFDKKFSFSSSPLWQHLKQMNIYSNNFYADKIFSYLGGVSEFHNFIDMNLNATVDQIKFETGSGLGENYTTCSLTMRMLQELENTIFKNSLELEQVISVPGSDAGTLRNRFKEKGYNKFLVAKTGTLRHTSTLSGYLLGEQNILFGVFNHTYDRTVARKLQNSFVKYTIDFHKELTSIEYSTPEYISLTNASIK